MSAEDPKLEEPSAPPPPPAAPASARAGGPPRPPGPSTNRVLLIAGLVVALLVGAYALTSTGFHFGLGKAPEPQFTVQPYTPAQHLVTTGEEVNAHAQPDTASPTLVIFGPDVALDVTGRVSRGLGNDWYAINWNSHTAFVRVSDTVAGEGAPPAVEVRPHQEEEIKKPEEEEQEDLENREQEQEAEQQSGPGDLSGINWVRAPNQRDFERYYPRRALYSGQDGRVVLDCVADGRGRLNCSVSEEAPRGFGFGNAAIGISRQLRIAARTSDGRSVEGGHLRLPLVFHAE